jgi:hypothetical protein
MSCTGREPAPLATLTSGLVATATPWAIKAFVLTSRNKANTTLDIPKLDDMLTSLSFYPWFIAKK